MLNQPLKKNNKKPKQTKPFLFKVKPLGAKTCMITLLNMCRQSHKRGKGSVFKTSVKG